MWYLVKHSATLPLVKNERLSEVNEEVREKRQRKISGDFA
jgi:hypothetical protein